MQWGRPPKNVRSVATSGRSCSRRRRRNRSDSDRPHPPRRYAAYLLAVSTGLRLHRITDAIAHSAAVLGRVAVCPAPPPRCVSPAGGGAGVRMGATGATQTLAGPGLSKAAIARQLDVSRRSVYHRITTGQRERDLVGGSPEDLESSFLATSGVGSGAGRRHRTALGREAHHTLAP